MSRAVAIGWNAIRSRSAVYSRRRASDGSQAEDRAGRERARGTQTGKGRRTEARDAGVVCGELPGRDAAGNKVSDGKWRSTQGEGSQRGRTLEEQWAEGPGGRR